MSCVLCLLVTLLVEGACPLTGGPQNEDWSVTQVPWIPACAGMTGSWSEVYNTAIPAFLRQRQCRRQLKSREVRRTDCRHWTGAIGRGVSSRKIGKEPKTARTEAQDPAGTRGFAALRVPNFRLYLAGSAFSRVGDNMEGVARSWLVWELTHDPRWLGFMVFFHWIPNTMFSIFAGVLADRVDNRKLIMYCESLYLLSAVGIGFLTLAQRIEVWQIALLLMLHGCSGAISNPSRQVFIHDTVGKEKLISAVSLSNSLFQTMQFIGPAVAGLLIATLGVGLTYMINAVAFVPAIVIMALIRVPEQRRPLSQLSPLRSSIEGLKHVKNSPLLLSLLALATLPALLVADSVSAMMPVFATQVLNVGAEGMGFLLSANGLGAIVAALAISYLGGLRRKGLMMVATSFLYGVLLVAFSFSSLYFLSMAILVGLGMTAVISQTVINTSLQLSAADNLRGRVMGLYSMGTLGVRSFNGPLIGFLAAGLGAPLGLGILGALVAFAVLVIAAVSPQRSRLD